jgi:3-deoxy-D-manno-octulosonate 8-phosphate phosphatase (KDO 8-P phosphatase)
LISTELIKMNLHLKERAKKIKLVLTDNDGVLTDNGVYYLETGESMKRFSIRDGMGVVRLRNIGIETGIITGELSGSVRTRAEKLKIKELFQGVLDKKSVLEEILKRRNLKPDNIAFIGDDINDNEIIKMVGLSASPADGMNSIKEIVDYVCQEKGGYGAFREFAEVIIAFNSEQ